jgi:DNA-binding HxlR family transcriptional regulator
MHNKIECPIMSAIAMISDKWKVLIICKLRPGKMRFNELKRALQGVTQRVLTHQLRELEADGLVVRTIFPEVPPRVEYALTELGQTLIPVLDRLEGWARDHSSELLDARRRSLMAAGGEPATSCLEVAQGK